MEFRILDTYAMIPVLKQKDSGSEIERARGIFVFKIGKDRMGDKTQRDKFCIIHVWWRAEEGRNMTFSNRGNS